MIKIIAACLLFLASCASLSNEDIYKRAALNPATEFSFTLSSGETRRAYEFYSNGGKGEDGIVIFVMGSGCSSSTYLPLLVKNAVGRYKYIALEKTAVKPKATYNDACDPEYFAKHTHASFAKDVAEFANAQFKKHAQLKNKILLGVSEGGAVAALAVPHIKSLTHLTIAAAGGGSGEDFIYEFAKLHGLSKEFADSQIEKIKNNPNNHEVVNGDFSVGSAKQSFGRFHLKGLEQTRLSILIAHGGKDVLAPLPLAAKACDELQNTKNKVTYFFEKEGAHNLSTEDQGSNKRFYVAIDKWVKGESHSHLFQHCPYK